LAYFSVAESQGGKGQRWAEMGKPRLSLEPRRKWEEKGRKGKTKAKFRAKAEMGRDGLKRENQG
jgi:hypothetical protein